MNRNFVTYVIGLAMSANSNDGLAFVLKIPPDVASLVARPENIFCEVHWY